MQVRHVFVVSREQRGLYEFLRAEFAQQPDVSVILDRRYGERRRRSAPRAEERRRGDRRTRKLEQLHAWGYAIVHQAAEPAGRADAGEGEPTTGCGSSR